MPRRHASRDRCAPPPRPGCPVPGGRSQWCRPPVVVPGPAKPRWVWWWSARALPGVPGAPGRLVRRTRPPAAPRLGACQLGPRRAGCGALGAWRAPFLPCGAVARSSVARANGPPAVHRVRLCCSGPFSSLESLEDIRLSVQTCPGHRGGSQSRNCIAGEEFPSRIHRTMSSWDSTSGHGLSQRPCRTSRGAPRIPGTCHLDSGGSPNTYRM